jgi:cytochrome c556
MRLRCIRLAAVAALPVLACSVGVTSAEEVAPGDKDSREAIVVTPAERNYILGQMRMFVTSIQTVAAGLGADDRAQAAEAASARGAKRNANDPAFPRTLDAKLPPQWKQLGGGMRRGFDALAQGINAGDGTQKSLEQLGIVMTNCIACHATYRVATATD